MRRENKKNKKLSRSAPANNNKHSWSTFFM